MRKFFILFGLALSALGAAWDPVPKVDLARLRPADFQDNELDMPFYLAHFKELADSVVEQGSDRGFINIPVWRAAGQNKPYNARIMESILSLAYFYTLKKPWNPYYGSPAVRQRLQAAMEFWCGLHSPDGHLAEAAPQRWNLASTAFSTKFMTRAIALLREGPPLDAELLKRVTAADLKTIHLVLTDPALFKYGTFVSNQFTNLFASVPAYLEMYPNAEIETLLRQRFHDGMKVHQSPAGHFYEEDGADFGYDIGTHMGNLDMSWHYVHGSDLGKLLAEQTRKWFEWIAYNSVPEKDWSQWILNSAVATRGRTSAIRGIDTPIGEAVTEARAFATSQEDRKVEIAARRRNLESAWPTVAPLRPGSMSPYAFLTRGFPTWNPTAAQRDEARRQLPYVARKEFVHQLVDDRYPQVYTYVRRPGYYAAFNTGKQISVHHLQRFGLGLLWGDATGAVLQSQSNSATAAWGTAADGAAQVYEAGGLNAAFSVGGKPVQPKPGSMDLPPGSLTVTYPLGDKGEKSLEFTGNGIVVKVRHSGEFTEFIPLLQSGDETTAGFTVSFDPPATESRVAANAEVGKHKLVVVRLKAKDTLTYRLQFAR